MSRSSASTKPQERSQEAGRPPAKGMVRVPGDTFLMGLRRLLPRGASGPPRLRSTASGWTSIR